VNKITILCILVILVSACGPSAEQITATAEMAKAETQTAAPTLTSTPTSTPSSTPTLTFTPTPTQTLTPSATPSLPKVMGSVHLNFVPTGEKTVIPEAPFEFELVLKKAGQEFTIKSFDSDGNFFAYLDKGSYTIGTLRVKNPSLKSGFVDMVTDGRGKISVSNLSCIQAGAITFTIVRLPPGSFENQVAQLQKMAHGAPLLFVYLVSGGLIMPISTRITNAGAPCPKVP